MKLKNNISIDTLLKEYEDKGIFNDAQLCNIKLGLMFGEDVEIYAKPEFNWRQMREIREGLEAGIDVPSYADPNIPWTQMHNMRPQLTYKYV